MTWRLLLFVLALGLGARLAAAEPGLPATWSQVNVAPSKTSIYVGSVSLTPGALSRHGTTLTGDYEVNVTPWFFWSETGKMTLTITENDLAKLAKGERTEFTGDATNHKNKPRQITGYADPADATTGKIKVRIAADGYTLIFNTTYELHP